MRAPNRNLTLRPRPMRRVAVCALMAAFACLLLVRPAARADDAASTNPEVRVTTNMGSFVIELRPDRAPLTVANFLRYVRAGFYTNTLFHRVVTNFVIQGGGHDSTPPYALKGTYPAVDNESGNGLQNKRGAVGLARTADPDTGNAQFYINLVDNPELDPLPTRWGYAVFGQVVEGMDVVDRIGVVPTGAFGPFKADAPLKPVIIQSIEEITPPGLSTPPASTPPAAPPAGAPPSGTPPAGTPPSGTPPSASPQSGSPPSSQSPASSPQAQPGKPGAPSSTPSSAKPAKPPAGGTSGQPSGSGQSSGTTPPQAQSQSGESDQPDGTDPRR
jgi:cyclophilin family peptidyl-prolyl cis-trans isomerase